MAVTKVVIDPITRIEGHLKFELEVEDGKVKDARVAGEMFRGFEIILKGRHPLDAQQITQRICGVCPASHAQASTLNLDSAFGVQPPDNGRIMRNLILGANFIQSHILHFYHLAALDYVDITAILKYKGSDRKLNDIKKWAAGEVASKRWNALAPFLPRLQGDYIKNTDLNIAATAHYIEALDMRRKAHEALAIFGGRMPHEIAIFPGGVSERPTVDKITAYRSYMKELRSFVDNVYIPDVLAVAKEVPAYFKVGKGCGNLVAYGVFEENNEGTTKFIGPGVYVNGKAGKFDQSRIAEYVGLSRYSSASGKHPAQGETVPDAAKKNAYSWLKSPRYNGAVCEVGPLARMGVAYLTGSNEKAKKLVGDTLKSLNLQVGDLFSVLGRHAARALETKLVADACAQWVTQLKPGKPVHTKCEVPDTATGMGLTEAPRGALGHWIGIKGKKIDRYQCVVPTTWNCSPRDDNGNLGPVEQALIGCPVADNDNPIEPLRVVRSFDPCIACAVHIVDAEGKSLSEFRVV
jgi:Ni,Fe-hydrogenase I large subunit